MTDSNRTKKTIVFSSEKEKQIIDSALDMLASVQKRTPSYILEDLVLKALLPYNRDAAYICRDLFLGERQYFSIFEGIFQIFAAGVGGKARYQNGREIMEFFSKKVIGIRLISRKENEGERAYFFSNFIMIKKMFEYVCEKAEPGSNFEFPDPVTECERLLLLEQDPNGVIYIKDFSDLFVAYWDVLGNYTYTFRELCSLCRLLELENLGTGNVADRFELVEIIKRLSMDWN